MQLGLCDGKEAPEERLADGHYACDELEVADDRFELAASGAVPVDPSAELVGEEDLSLGRNFGFPIGTPRMSQMRFTSEKIAVARARYAEGDSPGRCGTKPRKSSVYLHTQRNRECQRMMNSVALP